MTTKYCEGKTFSRDKDVTVNSIRFNHDVTDVMSKCYLFTAGMQISALPPFVPGRHFCLVGLMGQIPVMYNTAGSEEVNRMKDTGFDAVVPLTDSL